VSVHGAHETHALVGIRGVPASPSPWIHVGRHQEYLHSGPQFTLLDHAVGGLQRCGRSRRGAALLQQTERHDAAARAPRKLSPSVSIVKLPGAGGWLSQVGQQAKRPLLAAAAIDRPLLQAAMAHLLGQYSPKCLLGLSDENGKYEARVWHGHVDARLPQLHRRTVAN
jgi:hypothetical protein